MKLIIQIPCLNEEKTLTAVIDSLPKKIEGIDEIRTLIINDGSTDNTVDAAIQLGVDYIVNNGRNLGLAKSYSRGLEASLFLGADIIVNTDGDNQYCGEDIVKLVQPILQHNADVVIGCRDIEGNKDFSKFKKFLQKFGSSVVRKISGTDVPDTTSGFRAINRKAAITFSVMNTFSYTLETLIQAGRTGMNVTWVPISVNPKLRESRLFKSIPDFLSKQLFIIFNVYLFLLADEIFQLDSFVLFSSVAR
ncbi:MAG: glycosyltransferase family 2 protein [Nitrospirae bacterium]|nr:glycosyltransferase family 2 protein [Nitrospirota bacterium]